MPLKALPLIDNLRVPHPMKTVVLHYNLELHAAVGYVIHQVGTGLHKMFDHHPRCEKEMQRAEEIDHYAQIGGELEIVGRKAVIRSIAGINDPKNKQKIIV